MGFIDCEGKYKWWKLWSEVVGKSKSRTSSCHINYIKCINRMKQLTFILCVHHFFGHFTFSCVVLINTKRQKGRKSVMFLAG